VSGRGSGSGSERGVPERADTNAASSSSTTSSLPAVALPKGGGAIRGIGEKLAANPVTGTSSGSVPIACSPGRSGFGPQLALTYDSGAGNGPFGFGWSLALPQITRKTDQGLPRYQDSDESDVFLLAGTEDLVPWLAADGTRLADDQSVPGYTIRGYRPRLEGLFARIERWTRREDGDTHWRTLSRDNVLTVYGHDANSRIADPEDAGRVFSWLLCESRDDKGNAILYDFKAEDGASADPTRPHQQHRGPVDDPRRAANRYLKRVRYGNLVPFLDPEGQRPRVVAYEQLANAAWLFEVVFDYGEHHPSTPTPADTGVWNHRTDAFSSYRAGFEVRTARLCQRVLMFHHFPNEPEVGNDCLVRSTDFGYGAPQPPAAAPTARYTFLRSVTQSSYRRRNDGYLKRTVPPVEYQYSEAAIQDTLHEVDPDSLAHLPIGLDGSTYQWTDLHGEGLPGILVEYGGAWLYQRNLTPIRDRVEFAPARYVASKPNVTLADGQAQLLDLAGDGQPDLVTLAGPAPGFYEHDTGDGWTSFRPFPAQLHRNLNDANLRFVDLDGDGRADLLITEGDALVWHPSLGERGFGAAQRVLLAPHEEKGPRLVFADSTESIHLADLSGDGLADLVRIRNGEVCYWPNLGYGRFGAKVTMDRSPRFDHADQFEHRRLRLADLDGSGTTDLIYLHRDGVRLYFNESGNGWSEARHLHGFPRVDDLATVLPLDLLGNGTACLVWSSSSPADAMRQLRYVDLMGGQKPHLLISTRNNLGTEIKIDYASSTKFSLADQLAGRPWITRLPFPVHVVERVETLDRISGNRFVSRYAYHHGAFDGVEREFRGFGMVEQWDTEEFSVLEFDQQLPPASNLDATSHVPPLLTRTWFHTGLVIDRDRISNYFAGLGDAQDRGEYFREPGLNDAQAQNLLLDDTVLPSDLTLEEERQACRALKGAMLRQEIYALDGTDREPYPYSVSEQTFTIRRLQPRGPNRHAVFLSHPRESLAYHYERIPDDPRISHQLTLEVNDFGNVLAAASVTYGRRTPDPELATRDQVLQAERQLRYARNHFTVAVNDLDQYRAPVLCESLGYELADLPLAAGQARYTFDDVRLAAARAPVISYEQPLSPGVVEKRLIEHTRTLYRSNTLDGALPLGLLESLAMPFESYKLAFTPGLLSRIYDDRVDPTMMESEGGYVQLDGDGQWWIPSGRVYVAPEAGTVPAAEFALARQHFFLPRRFVDPFGQASTITHDVYDLLLIESRDALDNLITVGERDATGAIVSAGLDYRVLAPRLVTDPNGNRTEVSFDTLGMVVGTAAMGKREEVPRRGDLLEGFEPDLPDSVIAAHLAAPLAEPAAILAKASTRVLYDLFAYYRTREQARPSPSVVYTLARETHDADLAVGELSRFQHGFTYSDGFGREIQKKLQAEPGPVPDRGSDGQATSSAPEIRTRWIGGGWTVFNNKGKPVRQFEPYFTERHTFEFDARNGVSPTIFYDPMGRTVATLHPDHTWEKRVFGPWRQETWDTHDTALIEPASDSVVGALVARLEEAMYLPTWYAARQAGALGALEQAAAAKTAVHAATPALAYTDSFGRTFLTIVHNRYRPDGAAPDSPPLEEHFLTRIKLDAENNVREQLDSQDRVAARYDYDLLARPLRLSSMEAGERWRLHDVAGRQLRTWDSRGHRTRMAHDALGRLTMTFVQGITQDPSREFLVEKIEYGEADPDRDLRNLRTKPARHYDGAGLLLHDAYDFHGNLLSTRRQLVQDYKTTVDWSTSPTLAPEVFVTATSYDAIGRPVAVTSPDGSVVVPTFNESNLLERVEVRLRGTATATPFVTQIDYDAKGQRQRVQHGNGVVSIYDHDPTTFRLARLRTQRGTQLLQDLSTTYDAAGNVSYLRDNAAQDVYFANQVVTADRDYTYDATYRLIGAEGREHVGQLPQPQSTEDDRFRTHLPHPNDGQAMRRYAEAYAYDPAGNLLSLVHRATGGNWTRGYRYDEPSSIDPSQPCNRLSSTSTGDASLVESYSYDAHGNLQALAHLPHLEWDFHDALRVVDLGGGGTAYYTYDATGQRTRKVVEKHGGALIEERIYLGAFEVYRERRSGMLTLERQTLHIRDDQQRIALVETRTHGSEPGLPAQLLRYQHGDPLGSSCLELDDQAQILSYEEYAPYGCTTYQAVRSQTQAPKRYRYLAMERDDETGFAYHTARYYLPWLGRWLSPDPSGTRDGLNLYQYCNANPVTFKDTNGHEHTLAEINRFLDTSGDHKITLKELTNLGCMTEPSLEAWASMMELSYSGYTVDRDVEAIIKVSLRQSAAKNAADAARAYEQNETALRMHTDGSTYTNRTGREATRRSLDRYQDPRRLVAPVVVLAVVAAPQAVAVVGAFDTGVKTGEAVTGRHAGISPSDVVSGNAGNFGAQLTPNQRASTVKSAALGWVAMGFAAAAAGGPRDLHAEAVAARDGLAGELATQRHPPATVVGAYSPSSGRVTAGASRGGGRGCAEGVCSEALGHPRDIQFTPAVRPRTGQPVDVCPNCESAYSRGAFPDPATRFSTDQGGQ
jgi:RHS repeat-associated protein